MNASKTLSRSILCLLLVWGLAGPATARAELKLGDDCQPDDAVNEITVTLHVGADGDALDEPVALDLGLGVPFWLHPLGRGNAGPEEEEGADESSGEADAEPATKRSHRPLPFGAVAQQATAGRHIEAGQSATFTFSVDGEPGADALRTCPQLLAGGRVADISRIGLIGTGKARWVLAGYEIYINDSMFAKRTDLSFSVEQAREDARERIGQIGLEAEPLRRKLADLRALKKVDLADEGDLQRIAELEGDLAPLDAEQAQLQGVLDGRYPFYLESDFEPESTSIEQLEKVKVTLLTDTHTAADTRNCVYFRAGGRKYLLSGYERPLYGAGGPQTFDLDLRSAALAKADLAEPSVGMLAHGEGQGRTPDRWHLRRLQIEADGELVYDSEEHEDDRKSLSAIRFIPPAHFDEQDHVVVNDEHTEREVYLWTAGKRQGLNERGEPQPLPLHQGDPGYPQPEPPLGLVGPFLSGRPSDPPSSPNASVGSGNQGGEPQGTEGTGCPSSYFPGEQPWSPGGSGAYGEGTYGEGSYGEGPYGEGTYGEGTYGEGTYGEGTYGEGMYGEGTYGQGTYGQGTYGGGTYGGETPWFGGGGPFLGGSYQPPQPSPIPPNGGGGGETDPPPQGDPPTLSDVGIVSGWRTDDPFKVRWVLSGYEGQVVEYSVELRAFDPATPPLEFELVTEPAVVGPGNREATVKITRPPQGDLHFVLPVVRVRMSDGTVHEDIGPVRPVFPPQTDLVKDAVLLSDKFYFDPGDGKFQRAELTYGTEVVEGVSTFSRAGSHLAYDFDVPLIGKELNVVHNVALRPTQGSKKLAVGLMRLYTGKVRLLGHLGFLGGSEGVTSETQATVKLLAAPIGPVDPGYKGPLPAPIDETFQTGRVQVAADGSMTAMAAIDRVLDAPDAEKFLWSMMCVVEVDTSAVDPNAPPALFAVRVVPVTK